MSDGHDPAHEEQLFALCGAAADAPGALRAAYEASPLAGCAACRALVSDFADTEQVIAGAAASQRVLERTARTAPPAPGEERVRRALVERAERATRGVQRVEAPRVRRAWRAVAAVLVVALIAQTAWLLTRPKPTTPLGGEVRIELLAPIGDVAGFAPFTWQAELPPRGGFRVRVHGERPDGTPFELESEWLGVARWDPPEAETANWPAEIRWEVEVVDASSLPRGAASARATRRGP